MGLQSYGFNFLQLYGLLHHMAEMMKGNYSMIGSLYTSIPVKGKGLPTNVDCLPGQSRTVVGFGS